MPHTKSILIPLSDGFEEAEFIGITDVLVRAGIQVFIAGIQGSKEYTGAHGIQIFAPLGLEQIDMASIANLDGIAMPGGFENMQNLKSDKRILQIVQMLHSDSKLVSAICASPIVLNAAGVLQGSFTCYPSCEAGLNGTYKNQAVVVDKNIITSAGPATAILFGLEIVKYLLGEAIYQKLYGELLVPLTR